jgi:hypothetical protein
MRKHVPLDTDAIKATPNAAFGTLLVISDNNRQ